MAKVTYRDLFSVGDTVIIQKRPWKITQVFIPEKRYRVIPMFEPPNPAWCEMFPMHEEISHRVEPNPEIQ